MPTYTIVDLLCAPRVLRLAVTTFCALPLLAGAAQVEVAPNRLEFSMPAFTGGVSIENQVMLFSGVRGFCATGNHGKPERATLYLFDPAHYSGNQPEISAGPIAGCFTIKATLSKTCRAGDEGYFRALPRVTAAFSYPTSVVETSIAVAPQPEPPPISSVKQLVMMPAFCSAALLAQTRVCSLPGTRLARVSAEIDPEPPTQASIEMAVDYGPGADGPCVNITAKGTGIMTGVKQIPKQFPVTKNSPKLNLDICKPYPGGFLKIKATYSQVGLAE